MPRLHRSSSRCTFVNQRTDRANAHPMSRASCGHHSHQPVKEPRGHGFTFPRHELPGVMLRSRPSRPGGRRECRMLAAPMARLQQITQAAGTTGQPKHSGTPCATVLTAASYSPRGAGLVSPRPPGLLTRGLISASGDQDHTTWPSALASLVWRPKHVHRIPLSTLLTMRSAPLASAGWAERNMNF